MSQVKILVLGASGMLGHKMFQLLRQRFPETVGCVRGNVRLPPLSGIELLQGLDVRSGIDILDTQRLATFVRGLRPDFVVNCIGVTKQDPRSQNRLLSIKTNALLPHILADLVAGWGGHLIHFSTDCVFDGRRGAYIESDSCNATDVYGQSKALGEVFRDNALTLRSSFLGRELSGHRSLLDWFLAQRGGLVKGFRRVIYSGVTTNEMARVVVRVIGSYPDLSGLFHVSSDPITKYDLLGLLRNAYGLHCEVVPVDEPVSDRSMVSTRFRDAVGYESPPWPELVADLVSDSTPYKERGIAL